MSLFFQYKLRSPHQQTALIPGGFCWELRIKLLYIFNHMWALTWQYPTRWQDSAKKDNNEII